MSLAFYGEKHPDTEVSQNPMVVCHLHLTVRNTGYDLTYLLVVTCRVVMPSAQGSTTYPIVLKDCFLSFFPLVKRMNPMDVQYRRDFITADSLLCYQ